MGLMGPMEFLGDWELVI